MKPLFFIGSSPSMAAKILDSDRPAAGVMISVNTLRDRKSDFKVADWILDSGAFTEIARHGQYRWGIEMYCDQIRRWNNCGKLLIAIAQDWMCEPFVLERTGLSVTEHQRLTIDRYEALLSLTPPVPIMPVLQGYRVSDYVAHLQQYGDRLQSGQWTGVGSVCRRNGNPREVADILRSIKLLRPDLRLHGFGLKVLALKNPEVRSLLHSCDSMAWSYPLRFRPADDSVQNRSEIALAHTYQQRVYAAGDDFARKRIPSTAGAGNGQGRKPKWKSPTKAMRLPGKYEAQIIDFVRSLEEGEEC